MVSSASNSAAAEWRSHWLVPLSAAVGYATAVLHTYGIGPFFGPLQDAFGWSRAEIALGLSVTGAVGALFSVPMGLLVDRFGPRRIAIIGVCAMCGAFASFGSVTGQLANWLLLWTVLAFANLFLQATVWTSAVASRFERSRGLAFAITLSGASLSAAITPVLATWLIQSHGWRFAFVGVGGIWAVIVLPVVLIGFRGAQDVPQRADKTGAAAASILPGVSVAEAFGMPAFYKLTIASGLFTLTVLASVVHFVPILVDRGTSPLSAAGVASMIGLCSIVGRLGTGVLLDRVAGHRLGAFVFMLPVIASLLLLLAGTSVAAQMLAAASLGLTLGAEIDVIAYLATRHVGLRHFGVLFGTMVGAMAVGIAFGPIAAGAVHDSYGTYDPFLVAMIVAMTAGSAAMATLGPARFGTSHS